MGGKALKNTYTERKNTIEFQRIGIEIQSKLFAETGLDSTILKCYNTKQTHGDLDLLIKIPFNKTLNLRKYIETSFIPNEIFSNGGVYSFDYQNFQIDFIPIFEDKWEIAKTYGFYDPLGNIMGKTFHKFGLSYGWNGLYYKYRDSNGINSADILISTDSRKIFEFGGYNYDRYLKGFEMLEDIIKFAISSKYFDTKMFEMENLNHIDKKRNMKRGSYHLFLNYLHDNKIDVSFPFSRDKTDYLSMIASYFPEANLLENLKVLQEKDKENKLISQKFNGDMVMMWLPMLKGKELGAVMAKFKESLGDNYRDFILNSTFDAIKKQFMSLYYE